MNILIIIYYIIYVGIVDDDDLFIYLCASSIY